MRWITHHIGALSIPEVGVAVRTVHKIKIRALEQLAGMYQFTGQHS